MSEGLDNIDFSKVKNEDFNGEKDESNNYKENEDDFKDIDLNNYVPESCIVNLIPEENKEIGFDLSLIKRNELSVNLIHFDLRMLNNENYKYYNDFKVDVDGGFQAIDNLEMLKKCLEAIKKKNSIYCNILRL